MALAIVLGVIIVIGICFLIVGIIDNHRFRVVEETIVLDHLKKNCRFILLSDLHNHIYGKDNQVVIDEIRKAKPDFVIVAGDLVTSKERESTKPGEDLVNAISKEVPVYYAMGNHETKIRTFSSFGDTFKKMMRSINHDQMHVLINESVELKEYNIKITGLELPRYYYSKFRIRDFSTKNIVEMVGEPDASMCNLLIAHNPDYFRYYADWGADFVLSGHVHGGIMRLPVLGGVISPAYVLFPEYDGGIFHHGKSTMLLGRGMGTHTLPFRFFNPGELYIVNCLRK